MPTCGLGYGSVFVDLLFELLSIVCWSSVCVFVFFLHFFVSILFCNHLEGEEQAGYFANIVLQMHCYYKGSEAPLFVCSV